MPEKCHIFTLPVLAHFHAVADIHAYAVVVTCARMAPLRSLVEGVPYDSCNSADQSHGPLAIGARGSPQAQRGSAYRYLLPSTPRQCPLLWPWGRGAAPGDSGWPSCPL